MSTSKLPPRIQRYNREMTLLELEVQVNFLTEELKELNAKIDEDDTETALRFAYLRSFLDCAFDNLESFALENSTEGRTSDCESGTRIGTTGQH